MNKDLPLVSVIIPYNNVQNYIWESIESILLQSYKNFELILIDDGSYDQSYRIVQKYVDKRIRHIRFNKNYGVAFSRNIGIDASKGKYIAFLDSDDRCYPNRLDWQVEFMESNADIGLCGTWVRTFGDKKSVIWRFAQNNKELKARLLLDNPFATSSIMLRKKTISDNEIYFNAQYKVAEDYDCWERISKYCDIQNIPEVLVEYRIHNSQMSKEKKEIMYDTTKRIRERQLKQMGLIPSAEELSIHNLAGNWTIGLNERLFCAVETWLMRLYEINVKKNIYDVKTFGILLYKNLRYLGIKSIASRRNVVRSLNRFIDKTQTLDPNWLETLIRLYIFKR